MKSSSLTNNSRDPMLCVFTMTCVCVRACVCVFTLTVCVFYTDFACFHTDCFHTDFHIECVCLSDGS